MLKGARLIQVARRESREVFGAMLTCTLSISPHIFFHDWLGPFFLRNKIWICNVLHRCKYKDRGYGHVTRDLQPSTNFVGSETFL